MGLELAELALEIQERYAIELEDDDYANMSTFGDVVDTVKRKIDRPLDPATNETGKEIILQSLLAELRSRLPKDVEINEETQLCKLNHYVKHYGIWSFVQQRFPDAPAWDPENRLIFLGTLGVGITFFVIMIGFVLESVGMMSMSFLLAVVGIITFARQFWVYLRVPYSTLRDVAHVIAEKRQTLLKVREYSADDIENELREYMSKAFALKPEVIRRESELVKDLGLG